MTAYFQQKMTPELEAQAAEVMKKQIAKIGSNPSTDTLQSPVRKRIIQVSDEIYTLMKDGRERTISDILYIISIPHRTCVLAVRHLVEQGRIKISSSSGIPIYRHAIRPASTNVHYSRVDYLMVLDEWRTTSEVAQRMGRTRNATHQALALLETDGRVEKRRAGKVNQWRSLHD